jgi:hypothetical protein
MTTYRPWASLSEIGQRQLLEAVIERHQELVGIQGLAKIVVDAAAQGLDRRFRVGMARGQDELDCRTAPAQGFDQVETGRRAEANIEYRSLGVEIPNDRFRLLRRVRDFDLVAFQGQEILQPGGEITIVIDDQDSTPRSRVRHPPIILQRHHRLVPMTSSLLWCNSRRRKRSFDRAPMHNRGRSGHDYLRHNGI